MKWSYPLKQCESIKYIYPTLHTDEKPNENPDADGHHEQLSAVIISCVALDDDPQPDLMNIQ